MLSGSFNNYLELTKPRLTSLVLVTTAAGWWMGSQHTESWVVVAAAMAGTALVAGGANALNEWAERDFDALMQRTKNRPIPSGKVKAFSARLFGWILVIGGLALLVAGVNHLAAMLALLSAASYLYVYTPLKRQTAICTLAGAIPGAIPPMIGWAAARNRLDLGAWAIFLVLFVWQLPHFLALARLYRDDYARAGYKMLSVVEPTGKAASRQAVLYGLVLIPSSLFPSMIGLAGQGYFYAALFLSIAFWLTALWAAKTQSVAAARGLFRSSLAYLPLLLAALALDKGPK